MPYPRLSHRLDCRSFVNCHWHYWQTCCSIKLRGSRPSLNHAEHGVNENLFEIGNLHLLCGGSEPAGKHFVCNYSQPKIRKNNRLNAEQSELRKKNTRHIGTSRLLHLCTLCRVRRVTQVCLPIHHRRTQTRLLHTPNHWRWLTASRSTLCA